MSSNDEYQHKNYLVENLTKEVFDEDLVWDALAKHLNLIEKTPGHFYDTEGHLHKLVNTKDFKGFKRMKGTYILAT